MTTRDKHGHAAAGEREAFEVWAKGRLLIGGADGLSFVSDDCQPAWEGWKARASLSTPASGEGNDA